MKNVKRVSLMIMAAFALALTACQEEGEILGRNDKKAIKRPAGPGDVTAPPGGVPYPTIIERTYIPEYDLFDHTKCNAWRIEWPAYAPSVDADKIATFLATSTGSLNSLDYLNNTDNAKKSRLNFSLFTDQKIEAATEVIDLWLGISILAKQASFRALEKTVDQIKYMATERPELFEIYWDDAGSTIHEADYQEGDFYLFMLDTEGAPQYGGIRIVSVEPRIIEVYHAVPNL